MGASSLCHLFAKAYAHAILAPPLRPRSCSMSHSAKMVFLAALLAGLAAHDVSADPKTVCTLTFTSPDEKELLRRSLPKDEYRFVELVERDRPEWLESACRAGVRCDVLLIS